MNDLIINNSSKTTKKAKKNMGYDGRVREFVNREKWKCERIALFKIIETKTGKRRNHYNYMSGLTKKIWDAVLEDLKENGISTVELPKLLGQCGLSQTSIMRKIEGREETHLYELEYILATLNFKIEFNLTDKEIFRVARRQKTYVHKYELDRVLISRTIYPRFTVNFNTLEPTDLEIDFGKEKILVEMKEGKIVKLAMEAIMTYYNDKDKKLIFRIRQKINQEIRRQYLNDEILNAKKEKK